MNQEWESISEFINEPVSRRKIPGGYLYLYYQHNYESSGRGAPSSIAMCFVPEQPKENE